MQQNCIVSNNIFQRASIDRQVEERQQKIRSNLNLLLFIFMLLPISYCWIHFKILLIKEILCVYVRVYLAIQKTKKQNKVQDYLADLLWFPPYLLCRTEQFELIGRNLCHFFLFWRILWQIAVVHGKCIRIKAAYKSSNAFQEHKKVIQQQQKQEKKAR